MDKSRRDTLFVVGGAVVTLAVGVTLFVQGRDERRDSDALDERGMEVVAEVVSVSVDNRGDSTTSDVVVRFNHPGDDPTVTETEITYYDDFEADFPDAEAEGVRVVFDPEQPQRARIASESNDHAFELFIGAAVCAFFAIGLGVAAYLIGRRKV